MNAEPAKAPEPEQTPATVAALASLDLSGGEETPASTVGRVVVGLLLLILGGAAALAMFAAYVAGAFIPAIADIVDLLGDFLLYLCVIPLGIAITGFTLIRRNRKARAAEAKESAELIAKLGAAGALDGRATPAVAPGGSGSSAGLTITGSETHL